MNAAPFYIFAGILGLVIGAVVVWLLMADHPFEALETPGGPVDETEAALLAEELERDGVQMDEAVVRRLLELHGAYVEGRIKEAQEAADAARIEAARRSRAGTRAEGEEPEREAATETATAAASGPSTKTSAEPATDEPNDSGAAKDSSAPDD